MTKAWSATQKFSAIRHPNFVDRGLPGHREAVPQIPDLVERGKLRVERFHKKFNDQLADKTFIAGETFSVADITMITVVDFGPCAGDADSGKRAARPTLV